MEFRALAESLPHMIWTARASDGGCTYLSPQWVAYTGIPEAAQLGDRWLEQLHPDDVQVTKERWQQCADLGHFDTEFRIRRHDGVHRWFKTRAVRQGEIWYGSNTDIQELRDVRTSLYEANDVLAARAEERTRDLAEMAKELNLAQRVSKTGSWSFDLRRNKVHWSDELFRTFGLPVRDTAVQYEEQERLFEARSWKILQAAVARASTEAVGYELTLDFHRQDGTAGVAIARGEAVTDEQGVALLVGTFQDITERARTLTALRESTERLQLAGEAADLGIWEWHPRTSNLVWDEGMFRLYGVETAGFSGTTEAWSSALHPEDTADTIAALEQALASGDRFELNFRIIRQSDGCVRSIRAFAAIKNDGGETRVVGVNQDVTDTLQKETELRDLNRLLEERSKQQEVLLQEVHHRVKNNLQVVASLMNMQLRKLPPSSARSALEECRSRVETIALIHEQLYSSQDYAKVPIAEYGAKLARNIVASATDPQKIELVLAMEPVMIGVDKAIPCGLILNELLTNAIKHAFPDDRHGVLTVKVCLRHGQVELLVADDGVGIVDTRLARSASLGLQIVSMLVRQLDGKILCENIDGTRYTLTFPAEVHT